MTSALSRRFCYRRLAAKVDAYDSGPAELWHTQVHWGVSPRSRVAVVRRLGLENLHPEVPSARVGHVLKVEAPVHKVPLRMSEPGRQIPRNWRQLQQEVARLLEECGFEVEVEETISRYVGTSKWMLLHARAQVVELT